MLGAQLGRSAGARGDLVAHHACERGGVRERRAHANPRAVPHAYAVPHANAVPHADAYAVPNATVYVSNTSAHSWPQPVPVGPHRAGIDPDCGGLCLEAPPLPAGKLA